VNELALFAGAGGGLLASRWLLGWRTVCAVELEPYRREVLLRRQRDGLLDLFPIWDDARTFDGRPWRGVVDIVTAGFPCQPFSVAGKRCGERDQRNLWPDTIRIIREVRPLYVLLENVPGLLADWYFGRILGDLAKSGFDARWCVLGADDAGASHRRKRLWILAYTNHARLEGLRRSVQCARECAAGPKGEEYGGWWSRDPADATPESRVGRVADGVAHRVDRLRALGDGQVPAVVALAWSMLTQAA